MTSSSLYRGTTMSIAICRWSVATFRLGLTDWRWREPVYLPPERERPAVDEPSIVRAVAGVDDRARRHVAEESVKPELGQSGVVFSPVDEIAAARQECGEGRVVVLDARLVERDPHGGHRFVGHLRRRDEYLGR